MGRSKKTTNQKKIQIDVDWLLGESNPQDVYRNVWVGRLVFLVLFVSAATLAWPYVSKQVLLWDAENGIAAGHDDESVGLMVALQDASPNPQSSAIQQSSIPSEMPPVGAGTRAPSRPVVARLSDSPTIGRLTAGDEPPIAPISSGKLHDEDGARVSFRNTLRPVHVNAPEPNTENSLRNSNLVPIDSRPAPVRARFASATPAAPNETSSAYQPAPMKHEANFEVSIKSSSEPRTAPVLSIAPRTAFEDLPEEVPADALASLPEPETRPSSNRGTRISIQSDREDAAPPVELTLGGLAKRSNEELVPLLGSTQDRIVTQVIEELRRRGMRPQHVDIAMDLARGTTEERMLAMDRLVMDTDINPVPWLVWMASTAERPTRQRAISLLGSIANEDSMRNLRILKQREADHAIADQISQVLMAAGSGPRLKR